MPWLGVMAMALIGLVILYRPVLTPLLGRPFQGEQFGLGAFAVMISLWLVWQRRDALASCEIRPSPWGLALLLGGAGAFIFSQRMGEKFPASMSLPLTFLGIIVALWGLNAGRRLLVPAAFLWGAFPLPISVAGTIAFPLQKIVAALSAVVCGVLGSPVAREGVRILVDGHWLQVADACSGLSSFTALFWLWLLLVYLRGGGDWRRQILLLSLLLPIAIAANVFRVVIIVLIIKAFGPGPAFGWFHETLSLLVFGGTLALCFALIRPPEAGPRTEDPGTTAPCPLPTVPLNPEPKGEEGEAKIERGPGFRWQEGVLSVAVLALLLVAIPLSQAGSADRALVRISPDLIPLEMGSWKGKDLGKPPPEVIGPRPPKQGEYLYREYRSQAPGGTGNDPLRLYYVRSNRGRDAYIDIESITLNQGFSITESRGFTLSVGGRAIRARQLVLKMGPVWRVYVYSYFGPRRSAISRIGYKSLIALERGWLGHNPTWSLLWVATGDLQKIDPHVRESTGQFFQQSLELAATK